MSIQFLGSFKNPCTKTTHSSITLSLFCWWEFNMDLSMLGCDFFAPFSARLGFCTCVLTWLTVEYFNHCKRCARNVIVPLFMIKCPKCRVSIKMFRRTLLRSELPLTVPSHQTLRVLFSRRQQAALSHFISVRQGLSIVFPIFLRGLHFAQTYLSS